MLTIAGADAVEVYNTFNFEEEADKKKPEKVLEKNEMLIVCQRRMRLMNDMFLEHECSMKERLLIAFLQTSR